jgi:gliding motility-associated-like protein
MKKKILLSSLLLICLVGYSQTWTKLNSGITTALYSVSAPTASVIYTCGINGVILKTTDGGVTWSPQSSGTSETLASIFFTSVTNGTAVGDNGLIVRTTNGGLSWTPLFITSDYLRCIWFQNSSTGYITGGVSTSSGSIFKTTDGGASWTPLSISAPNVIYSIHFSSALVGYAAEFNGNIFKTTDGGASWSVPAPIGYTGSPARVRFTSLTNGIVCANNGIINKTTDAGASWSSVASGTTDLLSALDFVDANNGFIVGGLVGGTTGTILQTTNGGNSWSQSYFGNNRLVGVDFVDPLTAYAVGLGGEIIKWSNALPPVLDARFTSSEPGCLGQLENFYSVASGSGLAHTWNFGNGATPATSIQEDPSGIVYSTAGAKLVTHIVSNGTISDTVTNIITINPSPTAVFTSNTTACINELINFANTSSSGPGVSYSWDFGTGATPALSTAQNPQGVKYLTAGTKNITLTVTNQFDCVTSASGTIFINSLPTAFAGLDKAICAGTTVQLGGSPITGNTYSWQPSGTLSNAAIANPIASPVSPLSQYIVTVTTLSSGCKNTDTVNIIVNPTPVASFNSTAPACERTAVNFTNTGSSGAGVTYAWDFGNNANPALSTAQNPPGISYYSPGTKTITLAVTNQYGCVTSGTQTIAINAVPVAFAGLDKTVCAGTTVQLGGSSITGNSYSWQPSGTLSNAAIANPVASPVSPLSQYIVTVTTLSSGCKNTDTVNIIVNPTPVASFNSTAPACERTAVNFTNTGSSGAGVTYAWDFGNNANPALSTAQNPPGISYHSPGTKTITLAVTNQYGCVTSSTQTIAINAVPIAFAGMDTTICASTSVQLGQVGVIGNTYTWFPSSTLSNKMISNPIASPVAPVTSYILTVVSTSNGCKNTDTVHVTMLDPLKAYAGNDGAICRYDKFQLGTGLVKGQLYSWSPVKGLNNATLPNPLASPDSTTTYTLTVTGSGCGTITDNVTITVHPLPIVDAGADDTINPGTTTHLNASGGIQYSWFPVTGLSNPGIYDPLAYPHKTTLYTVTATDVYGCVDSDTMLLTVLPSEFWVPTAFTPDGNGISDVFFIRGEGIQNFECTVFNRWGEQIFISRNMNIGWDGKRQNGGEELPEGAYVYHIKGTLATGKQIASSGIINLIR